MKTAAEVRREAATMARNLAAERELCGDPEGAGELRHLAQSIDRIRILTAPVDEK